MVGQLTDFDNLRIAKRNFSSRLMLGTGRFSTLKDAQESIEASGASIVTFSVRRANFSKLGSDKDLLSVLYSKNLWLLPNTAGSKTAEDAIRMASFGREMLQNLGQLDNYFIKLEVINDPIYLLPDPIGTLKAAEYLVRKNFIVLPYISPDPVLARQLEEIGCSTIMPLASPIGSGQGLQNMLNISIIIQNAKIPVIIDAGIGTASESALIMELGADGVLLNTAVAKARSPKMMARAMKLGVQSGRLAYLAGRIKRQVFAEASTSLDRISYRPF